MDASSNDWSTALAAARQGLSRELTPTPLWRASSLELPAGGDLFFKLETRQITGSFKYRAALNGVLALSADQRQRGVVASSSGNYAAALAEAARRCGVRAQIVMTPSTAAFKVERTRARGAEVVFSEDRYAARQELVDAIVAETGALALHPHSSVETLAGNATCGDEILEQLPACASIVVPTSGGGLLGGLALAVERSGKKVALLAAQPTGNPTFVRSLAAGEPWHNPKVDSIADGLTADLPGQLGFAQAKRLRAVGGLATDDQIRNAMGLLASQEGLAVEPSAAVGLAAVLAGAFPNLKPPLVIVLTGRNVDPQRYAHLLLNPPRKP
ncbi:MAG: pyridoxal-phosphate dependent enzyme [Planctomycetota bacterium]